MGSGFQYSIFYCVLTPEIKRVLPGAVALRRRGRLCYESFGDFLGTELISIAEAFDVVFHFSFGDMVGFSLAEFAS